MKTGATTEIAQKTGSNTQKCTPSDVLALLEQAVEAALETYSNVHRGSGHNSMVSTSLFEQAREIVLDYLGLKKGRYLVVFCTPLRAANLTAKLASESYRLVASRDFGLPLGVNALVVKRTALRKGLPAHVGGGTARLISRQWVVWAKAPDRYEAGTPAIVNVIAFAKALLLIRQYGPDIFGAPVGETRSAESILKHDTLEASSGQELLSKLRQTLIGGGLQVPTTQGKKPFINLDSSASTRTFRPVWEAVCQAWRQPEQIRQALAGQVREVCAQALGAPLSVYDMLFTSNTTESVNLAAQSAGREFEADSEPVVLNTLLEHSSNDLPWRTIRHLSLHRLPVDNEGFIHMDELAATLRAYNQEGLHGPKRVCIVAVSGASNVLGSCNNLADICRLAHQYGARVLVDAAQLIAHRAVEMERWGVDYLTFSAHKVYAPFGTGMLVARKGMLAFSESEMEQIRLSGEENTVGITALGKALVLMQRIGMRVIEDEEQKLSRMLLHSLATIPEVEIYGLSDPESPRISQKLGVVLFNLKKKLPGTVARELASCGGIGVRYGCHCAHIIIKHLLHVGPGLEKFQRILVTLFPGLQLPGLVRLSLSIENTPADIDALTQALRSIVQKTANASMPEHQTTLSPKTVQRQTNAFAQAVSARVYS